MNSTTKQDSSTGKKNEIAMRAIAIDGPAAAGKTTTAKRVAAELGFVYCDTGALYRAIAVGLLDRGVTGDSPSEEIEALLPELSVSIETSENGEQQVFLNSENVTGRLRTEDVSSMASIASAIPAVRTHLEKIQKNLAETCDVVMEGRDIGTVILPHAGLKIFLTADPAERAIRRQKDLAKKGSVVPFFDVLKDMQERDLRDSTRASAPLKPAPDAVKVDNSNMTIEETVGLIVSLAEDKAFPIDSFRGAFDFLSNFYGASVFYDGLWYQNSEAAFQSAKTLDPEMRKKFTAASPSQAKSMGRMVNLRPDWEQVKDGIMLEILRSKFAPGTRCAERLLATGSLLLIEGNTWHDNYWGVCQCEKCRGKKGLNHLGELLERVRDELRHAAE